MFTGVARNSQNYNTFIRIIYYVVRCQICDREVTGSNPARAYCVPTPTRRVILPGSVNEH